MPTIRANDVELFYDLTGPEDAPVVVFSTSVGATLEMWDPQLRALSDRFRLLRYDTRGHGRSQVVDRPTSIEELADDLAGLLDALGIAKAHLVGLSLGGMTGQALALRHPDKLESLVLLATSAYLPPAEAWTERAATVRAQGMAAIADTVMSRWFTRAFKERAPAIVAATRERFVANDANGYAICCEAIRDMDLRPAIGAVRTPTLILAGADDPATPVAMMEDIRARIPDAEMIIVPRAAHLLNLERPEIVNAHLAAFLARFTDGRAASSGPVSFEAGLANRKAVLGDRACRALPRQGGRLRHAVAGLHHPYRLGRDLGRQDDPVENALHADPRHDDRPASRGGVQAARPPGPEQRRHHRRAARAHFAGGDLCRRAGRQRRLPLGEGRARGGALLITSPARGEESREPAHEREADGREGDA